MQALTTGQQASAPLLPCPWVENDLDQGSWRFRPSGDRQDGVSGFRKFQKPLSGTASTQINPTAFLNTTRGLRQVSGRNISSGEEQELFFSGLPGYDCMEPTSKDDDDVLVVAARRDNS
jgi:hypothetical protein